MCRSGFLGFRDPKALAPEACSPRTLRAQSEDCSLGSIQKRIDEIVQAQGSGFRGQGSEFKVLGFRL